MPVRCAGETAHVFGSRKKEPLARKPYDFEKLRSPTNAASDWRDAGGVIYYYFFYFILFATLITKNIGKEEEEEKKRSGEET